MEQDADGPGPAARYGTNPFGATPPDWYQEPSGGPSAHSTDTERHWSTYRPGSRRSWRWPVTVFVVLAAAVSAGVASFSNASTARQWRSDALAAREDLVEATEMLDRVRAEAAEFERRAATAEDEATALADRIDVLADEKAQALDDAAAAETGVEVFASLAQRAADVSAWLADCIEYQEVWNEVSAKIAEGTVYAAPDVERFTNEMRVTCDEAARRVADLEAALADPYGTGR